MWYKPPKPEFETMSEDLISGVKEPKIEFSDFEKTFIDDKIVYFCSKCKHKLKVTKQFQPCERVGMDNYDNARYATEAKCPKCHKVWDLLKDGGIDVIDETK